MTAIPHPPNTIETTIYPGMEPRLMRPDGGEVEDADAYREAGGYQPLGDPDEFLSVVEASGLRGRGGAAFPLGVKLRTVRDNGRAGLAPVVVANGEEGEPASVKDRWLMRHRPHLVLDGLRIAAAVIGADTAYVYVSDSASAQSIDTALAEADSTTAVTVVTVDGGYVAGEETAAVRAIEGGPPKPTDKPPRPFEAGVGGRPTLVSNVETLANLPFLLRSGSAAYRSLGTAASPGTFLATVTGAGAPPVLYELPHGIAFTRLLELHGVSRENLRGVLMGGYFSGVLGRGVLDVTLDHESIRRADSGLGCGAIALLVDECPVSVVADVLSYFDRENAGQCGSCFNGTAAMAAVGAALHECTAAEDDVARLRRWSTVLRGRGACGTLDGAASVAASLLREFPDLVSDHLSGSCSVCAGPAVRTLRPYEVEAMAIA